MVNQCLGLAEALLELVGTGIIIEKTVKPVVPWKWLPPKLWPSFIDGAEAGNNLFEEPWPDVLIGCGRHAVGPALSIKSRSAGKTFIIHVQHPRVKISRYDLISVPKHDGLSGKNVIEVTGSMHRVTPEKLVTASLLLPGNINNLPQPRIAILIGGSTSGYKMNRQIITQLGRSLAAIHEENGASFMVTTSRRTGADNSELLRNALTNVPNIFWNGNGENPYFSFLAAADAIIVTCDSVNMISEATASGKPVLIFKIQGQNKKMEAFHQSLYQKNIARPFKGFLEYWSYQPMHEPSRVAREVLRRIEAVKGKNPYCVSLL